MSEPDCPALLVSQAKLLLPQPTPTEHEPRLIAANYATYKHPEVHTCLKRHKRFHVISVPAGSSWLNMVERWFSQLTQKRIRRGTFSHLGRIIETIRAFSEEHIGGAKPFTWTAKAMGILTSSLKPAPPFTKS